MLQFTAMTAELPIPTAPVYSEYAAVYDRTGQIRFAILAELYLREILERHPVAGKRMLDLACGTGTLALLQAEAGWEVVGLDASAAMLAQARAKQQAAGATATFVEADMRDFALAEPVDLATCFYDSLNYLLEEEALLACFQSVYRALVPGGIFGFDLATDYFLRMYWQGTETFQGDNYTQEMQSSFDEATGHSTLILTGRVGEPDAGAREFREVHVERAYDPQQVRRLLQAAGLVPEALYDCFTHQDPNAESLRHFWVARKPASAPDPAN